MQQIPQITYCKGKNQGGKNVYTLSQNNVCVQTNLDTQLVGNEFISLNNEGLLTIRKGYSWNGMTKCPDFKKTMFPSLVHDALYQMMRVDFSKDSNENGIGDRCKFRKEADKLLLCLCRQQNGAIRFIAWIFYCSVRKFGKSRSKNTNFSYTVKRKVADDVTAPANGSVECR